MQRSLAARIASGLPTAHTADHARYSGSSSLRNLSANLYALAEAEATLACHSLGLDPGLGFTHLDAAGRDSLALDLMEPVRPAVENYCFDLVGRRAFHRSDFHESASGYVRLLPPLSHELAETLPRWRQAVAPWAERVAHLLGQAIAGKWLPTAPLSGRHRRQAQDEVRLRRAMRPPSPSTPSTKQRPTPQSPTTQPSRLTFTCHECGTAIPGRARRYCPACGVLLPGFGSATRARRGQAIAGTRAELEHWRSEHPGAVADPQRFRELILPGLASVRLRQIMDALDCAKSTASLIRSGRHVPALRHWAKLAALGGVTSPLGTSMCPG